MAASLMPPLHMVAQDARGAWLLLQTVQFNFLFPGESHVSVS